jgi:hypothetical protein
MESAGRVFAGTKQLWVIGAERALWLMRVILGAERALL